MGVALRSPDLPGVFDANLARVDGAREALTAGELLTDLDRARGDLWFDKLFVDDGPTGERLRGDLEAAGEIGTLCSLYTIGGVAQVEEVSTLARRGEGLAGAVVRAAVAAALDGAPVLVFIEADEDDWMKGWYERIGFAQVGRTWRFTRTRA